MNSLRRLLQRRSSRLFLLSLVVTISSADLNAAGQPCRLKRTFTSDFTRGLSHLIADRTWKTTFYFGGRTLPSNGERQYYSDGSVGRDPFRTVDGKLVIVADRSNGNRDNLPYSSGLLTTENSFQQTYGYFTARAKVPSGMGLWSAFWLLPKDKSWPPEIDVLEAFGAPNRNGEGGATSYRVGAIGKDGSQSAGKWIDTGTDLTSSFHDYAVAWQAQTVRYYFNGNLVFETPTPADMHKPMYMLVNLAVGGNWPGLPDESTKFPAEFEIAEIRAYAIEGDAKCDIALDPK